MLPKVLQGCQFKQQNDRLELVNILCEWEGATRVQDALPLLSGLFSLSKRYNAVCVIKAKDLTTEI